MKVLSLKLKEDIFAEAEKIVSRIHISRNAYINEALSFYNQFNKRKLLKKRLIKESRAVKNTSLEVLREFERFEGNTA